MQLEKKLSWGNIFSMLTVVIVAAIAYGVMTNRVAATEDKVKSLEQKADDTKKDTSELKTAVGRLDEKLKAIEKSSDRQELMLQELIRRIPPKN